MPSENRHSQKPQPHSAARLTETSPTAALITNLLYKPWRQDFNSSTIELICGQSTAWRGHCTVNYTGTQNASLSFVGLKTLGTAVDSELVGSINYGSGQTFPNQYYR